MLFHRINTLMYPLSVRSRPVGVKNQIIHYLCSLIMHSIMNVSFLETKNKPLTNVDEEIYFNNIFPVWTVLAVICLFALICAVGQILNCCLTRSNWRSKSEEYLAFANYKVILKRAQSDFIPIYGRDSGDAMFSTPLLADKGRSPSTIFIGSTHPQADFYVFHM